MSNSYSSPKPVVRVFIVRHGETEQNREGIIQGQMDTVLNEEGLIQAHLCGEALKDIDFEIAFTSDLKRAVQVISHGHQHCGILVVLLICSCVDHRDSSTPPSQDAILYGQGAS